MILLVTGGRDYADAEKVAEVLDERARDSAVLLVVGGAPGADALAAEHGRKRGWEIYTFRADWTKGKRAGPDRNARMVKFVSDNWTPDDVPAEAVAFPGGNGTADCVRRIRKAGIPLIEVAP